MSRKMNNVECYSHKVISTLFALLRCALIEDGQLRKTAFEQERENGKLDLLSFSAKEWSDLYSLSAEQGVMALTYDVLKTHFIESDKESDNSQNKLPFEIKKILIEWEISCIAVIKRYHKHLEVIKEIRSCVIPQPKLGFLILKGVAFSAYYPKPHLRESGDIDIYFYKNKEWFENFFRTTQNSTFLNSSKKHNNYFFKNVLIEMHHFFLNADRNKTDKKLNEILIKELANTKLIAIEGIEIEVGTNEFNFILMIRHAMVHFLDSSISIRHFFDIAAFIMCNPSNIFDYKKVRIIFEQHKLHRLYDVFIYFTIINFGTSIKLEEIREDRNDNEYFLIDEYLKQLLNDTFKIKKNIKENRRNNSNDYKYGLKRIYRRKNRQGVVHPTLVEDIMQFHKKIKKRHDQKWKYRIISKTSYYNNLWKLLKAKIKSYILP